MSERTAVRETAPSDLASIEKLYGDAFPDEDLVPLVKELLRQALGVHTLVAVLDEVVVGHVVFTRCGVAGSSDEVALLGPLAVARARQRQGIGSALVRSGLRRLESAGVTRVFVLGDPAYYGRLGFLPEAGVEPPYPLPVAWRGAWQGTILRSGEASLQGKLLVPPPWRRPGLWAP